MLSVRGLADVEGSPPQVPNDLTARRLLQCAQGALHKWPEGFPGFAASIRCRDGSEVIAGHVRVASGGRVDVDLPEGPLALWVRCALRAISIARTPQFFKDGDGRYPITFDPSNDDEVTRAVRVHLDGGEARVYRIDAKGRIRYQEDIGPV